MAWINVTDLTFGYEGSDENVFENTSFRIDTEWKTGFIGRNGKGKTTFLSLLMNRYEYRGSVSSSVGFDYFPYQTSPAQRDENAVDLAAGWNPRAEEWRVVCELNKLKESAELLYRPYSTLSYGERTKVMLAVLFSSENNFLLIDEPTNHLDGYAREVVKEYLNGKKGFLLVSHDRDMLDCCVDHVLVLNKQSIEVRQGNFSSWWEEKRRADSFALSENEKHKREIVKLEKASARLKSWADKNERTKIGTDPIRDHDRTKDQRAYIGAKTKTMNKSVKNTEKRIETELGRKEGLLKDIEREDALKITVLPHYKDILIYAKDFGVSYGEYTAFEHFDFSLSRGERVFLSGKNGCGKSSFIKAVLSRCGEKQNAPLAAEKGLLAVAPNLKISYIDQTTEFLCGGIADYCERNGVDETLFRAVLHKLGMYNKDFFGDLSRVSDGQKKKVLIAASLATPAHLYIWDEPLNYIDVFSRMQIEKLISESGASMLVVEHDKKFVENTATRVKKFS